MTHLSVGESAHVWGCCSCDSHPLLVCPMWGWPLLLAYSSAKPRGSREAFQSEMQTTLNIRNLILPDFQELPGAKLFQSCRVSLCGSCGPEQEWRWTAALGHGMKFGLFPPGWLGCDVLLGQGHNDLSTSLLSVR